MKKEEKKKGNSLLDRVMFYFIRRKSQKGKKAKRYLSQGAQPTVLEIFEEDFALLTSRQEKILRRREEIHSYLSFDIRKVRDIKNLFSNMDSLLSSEGVENLSGFKPKEFLYRESMKRSLKLNSLKKNIEKIIVEQELLGKKQKRRYVSEPGFWGNLNFKADIGLSWLLNPRVGLSFAVLLMTAGSFLLYNGSTNKTSQRSFIRALQVHGRVYKNGISLAALSKKKKDEIFTIKPGDEFYSRGDSLGRIVFDDHSTIQFGPESKFRLFHNENIETPDNQYQAPFKKKDGFEKIEKKLVLEKGIIHCNITKQSQSIAYLVFGKDFSIKVIGTRFTLIQGEKFSRLILEEGKIQINPYPHKMKRIQKSILIERPSMVELISKSKKGYELLQSSIPKKYLAALGAFNLLDKKSSMFHINPKNAKDLTERNIMAHVDFTSYDKNATLKELKFLQVFDKFPKKAPPRTAETLIKDTKREKVKESKTDFRGRPYFRFEISGEDNKVKTIKYGRNY